MTAHPLENSVINHRLKHNNHNLSKYVIQIVAKYYNIEEDYALAKNRKRENVFPRQVAMYLLAKFTDMSLQKIGAYFNKDHTTVVHSRKCILNLCQSDKKIKQEIKELDNIIRLRTKALNKKIDLDSDFYYIDFNDFESFKLTSNRGMILSGFTAEETKRLTDFLGCLLGTKTHKNTGFYILERKNEL